MLRINQIKLSPGHTEEALEQAILKFLRISKKDLLEYRIFRQSIDARKKTKILYVYTIDVYVAQEERLLKKLKNNIQKVEEKNYRIPGHGTEKLKNRPVIAGAGPSGLFCAYLLAKEGYRPILAERGAPVEERYEDVEAFWTTNVLNPHSNVQFGEGGAGTFSDGKLNTLVKDKSGRNRYVLETFVRFGAPKRILYEQKPHIGTDILMDVIRNMRNEILSLGGEIRFYTQVTDLELEKEGETKVLKRVVLNQTERFDAEMLVLAIGHSARDTFQMLVERGMLLLPKAFAVGVRIEHPQRMIQESQYGKELAEALPPAAYKLTENLDNGRGVYTFCMCPGGYVVNASSEKNRLAVNGMSYQDRAGDNANSAVIVTVTPEDFGSDGPLSGMEFQRQLEESAYEAGAGAVPVQCFGDFCNNRKTEKLGDVTPQIKGMWKFADVRKIFPDELAESLIQGIQRMDKKIQGFARADAVLSGVESRTSSPVRICRDEAYECNIKGIYPCGEGAGYAGGITSAAMDGMKAAEAIIQRFSSFS
ncbi:NAD(P)/FAD-dependent oxidoreductase [Mediterraneibacter agrestimuris]|uniref:NAD(P)/FAD-dependent oxidoreductase n=1 Tax=Mediterraneibacter agrestimuris TaxID=2941333 RepID=UPI0020422390|nr:FAD-dependent oxidoreductase [Mediterraneibacter agrestimuris]